MAAYPRIHRKRTDCGAGTAQTGLYLLADRGQRFHNAPEAADSARIHLGKWNKSHKSVRSA